MENPHIYLPGDQIPPDQLPTSHKRKLGPGIHSPSPDTYISTLAGPLQVDFKRKTASISTPTARYTPRTGDLVIAQVRVSSTDFFHVIISPYGTQAILPQLAFEGATKKTRPQLKSGDLVYAKVVFAQRNMDIELSCVNPSTGKAEPDGLGPLSGGMVFDVSAGLAERMLRREGCEFLEELGGKITGGFEICVGRNGRVWIDSGGGVRGVIAVGRCLKEVDGGVLGSTEQKKVVTRIVTEMGVS
jgi:exosome complex component RRP40